jgi:hypothetical protein
MSYGMTIQFCILFTVHEISGLSGVPASSSAGVDFYLPHHYFEKTGKRPFAARPLSTRASIGSGAGLRL